MKTRSGVVPAQGSSRLPKLWDEDTTEVTETTGLKAALRRVARRPRLTVMTGAAAGQVLALDVKTQHLVGRSRSADIRIEETGVSRLHCSIVLRDDGVWVEDMGSTNGTLLNGEPVRSAKLAPGDRIQLGPDAMLQFGVFDDAEDTLARKLYEASTRDATTGAYNHRYFSERLEAETAYARRHESQLSIVLFEVDDLPGIMEAYGVESGDVVLRTVASAMTSASRSDELLCRSGAGFALLIRDGQAGAAQVAERLRAVVETARIPFGRKVIRATVSAGIAEIGERGAQLSADGLVRLVTKRLERAKALGKSRISTL